MPLAPSFLVDRSLGRAARVVFLFHVRLHPTHRAPSIPLCSVDFLIASMMTGGALVETRATENQYYILFINYAGDQYGGSIAMPPWNGRLNDDLFFDKTTLGTDPAPLSLTVRRTVLDTVRSLHPYRAVEAKVTYKDD